MSQKAEIYRMVTDNHICPYGIRSKDLLKRYGYEIEDHPLKSREETNKFKEEHKVSTTPQTFIEGKRIGGYEDLRNFFGKKKKEKDDNETTYQPIIAIFATTFMMALAMNGVVEKPFSIIFTLEKFIALSMCVLGILKLRDLYSFTNQFITYDIVGRRNLKYAYTYPFIETLGGIAMLGMFYMNTIAPLVLITSTIGAISVIKAVYIDKRDLKCACVGGDSNVPLGFISLSENLAMMAISIWMLVK